MLKNVHMDSKADKVNDCHTPLPLSRGELSDSKQMTSIKRGNDILVDTLVMSSRAKRRISGT